MGASADVDISVIVPVFNEVDCVETLVDRVTAVLQATGRTFELLLIDDGSTDGSQQRMRDLCRNHPRLRVLMLARNYGQSAAMTAGFDHAHGRIVVSMDGDLQNDPADIPGLVAGIEAGSDLVCGWRRERRDPFWSRRLPSLAANWLISRTTGVRLHDYGCTFKAYRRDLAGDLLLYGELHRFIPVLANARGAIISEQVVAHHPRTRGDSKYGMARAYRVVLDLLLMLFFQKFATQPLKFFGLGGGALFAGGVVIELYLSGLKLLRGVSIGQRPLLLLGALMIISGIMLLGIGLLAELVIRTYYEASNQSIYRLRETVGGSPGTPDETGP